MSNTLIPEFDVLFPIYLPAFLLSVNRFCNPWQTIVKKLTFIISYFLEIAISFCGLQHCCSRRDIIHGNPRFTFEINIRLNGADDIGSFHIDPYFTNYAVGICKREKNIQWEYKTGRNSEYSVYTVYFAYSKAWNRGQKAYFWIFCIKEREEERCFLWGKTGKNRK